MTSQPTKLVSVPRVRARVVLQHEGGLHARPAIKLTRVAKRFRASVWIAQAEQGPWIDAKSVARVMGMKTPNLATLHLLAEGPDAEAATRALTRLVETDFADDHGR